MKIPQTISSSSILIGGSIPQASASVFAKAAGVDSLARGLSDVADSLIVTKRIEDRIKQNNDRLWANKTLSTYHRTLTDFEVDPKNQSRVDILPAFNETADGTMEELAKDAPSQEALEMFTTKARGLADTRYPRVATQGVQNQMNDDMMVLESSWNNTLTAFHAQSSANPEAAASDLTDQLANEAETIMEMYGDIAPELSRKLISKRVEEAALALVRNYPTVAKDLITKSPFVDEQTRQQMLTRLESQKKEGSILLKDDFSMAQEKAIVAAKKSGEASLIPLGDYEKIYDNPEEAVVAKRQDDEKIHAAVDAHNFITENKGKHPGAKMKNASAFAAKLDTNEKLWAFGKIVEPALTRDAQLFKTDSVQWLYENNDTIATLQKEVDALETPDAGMVLPPKEETSPEALNASRVRLQRAILKFQGSPVAGEDPDKFMNKAPGERHLLAKSQADALADQINSADIDTVISIIKNVSNEYPDASLQAQAIHDLTVLPTNKIKPEYQIAFQNKDQPWLPDFIGALRSVGDLSNMNPVEKAEITNAVAVNANWLSFRNAVIGPQNQRSSEVAGYFDAIETYAKTKVAKGGMKPKDAAAAAVAQVLTSTMAPIEIKRPLFSDAVTPQTATIKRPERNNQYWLNRTDNQELWLPRTLFGETKSDETLQDLGRRMGIALSHIHPDDVDLNQFPDYKRQDIEEQRRLIYNRIVDTGSYYPAPDGHSYHVTVASSVDGSQVDLRTKDGKLLALPIDALPGYTTKGWRMPDSWTEPWAGDKPVDYPISATWRDGYPETGTFWKQIE
jgi:hypothetical protein